MLEFIKKLLIIIPLYLTSHFCFSYFVCLLFYNSQNPHKIAIFLIIISMILGFALTLIKARILNLIFAIIPNINLFFFVGIIDNYDISTIRGKNFRFRGITYEESLGFFIIQFILFPILIIIINCFKNGKCCYNNNSQRNGNNLNDNLIQNNENNFFNYHQELSMEEQQLKEQNRYLGIVGITKTFGNKRVINNFNLELFPGEIFCLLGLDGAGKTTLINMILGLIFPEKGDILYNGRSLPRDRNLIYKNISICPQENNIFENLEIIENFEYRIRLDRIQPDFNEIQKIINYFNLYPSELLCTNLTKEQKRILCCALSLSEMKNILILDEPTKGIVSLDSKRKIWDLIKCNLQNNIIIVSTSSLEEAKYLGTKIGIIREGNLVCSGDIDYLLYKYNKKSKIKLLINPNIFNENNEIEIIETIKVYEPNSELKKITDNLVLVEIKDNRNLSQIIHFLDDLITRNIIKEYEIEIDGLRRIFDKINNSPNLNRNEMLNNELYFNNNIN